MYSRILSRRQMTIWCITLSGALALCIGLQGLLGWGRTQLDTGAALAADTLRLHIRAASDTTADQTDKLAVRDAVLAYLDTACPAADQPSALRWAAAHLSELQRVARTVLAGRGSFAPVRVYLVEMYFGTTRYSASALPAGRYQALRIDIGAAPYGRNWWCVLYPGIVLRQGSSGGTVRLVQQKLNALGEKLSTDGKYGASTAAAVERYQRRNGLTADGAVGKATWEKMF